MNKTIMQKKKLLIVGSNGYLGSRFIELLNHEYKVLTIDRNFFKECIISKPKKTKLIKKCASKLNEKDLENVSAVIFFAALNNDPKGNIDPKIYNKEINYTIKAAKLCKKKNIKFIYPSSCSVYGYGKSLFNENSKTFPLTLYSKNKILIEKKLNKLKDKKFKPLILRLSTVFGPSPRLRLDLVANMFTGMSLANNIIELNSNGLSWRPHVYIDDVCNVILFFLKYDFSKMKNNIINVGHDKNNILTIKLAKKLVKINKLLKIIKLTEKNKMFSDKKVINGVDKRSYRVSFLRLKKIMKKNYKMTSMNTGLLKLNNFLKKNKFNKKSLFSKKYYRLQWYDYLIKHKGVKIY